MPLRPRVAGSSSHCRTVGRGASHGDIRTTGGGRSPGLALFVGSQSPSNGAGLRTLFPWPILRSFNTRDVRARESHRSTCRWVQSRGLLGGRRPRAATSQYFTRMTISVHPPVRLCPCLYVSKLPQITKKDILLWPHTLCPVAFTGQCSNVSLQWLKAVSVRYTVHSLRSSQPGRVRIPLSVCPEQS